MKPLPLAALVAAAALSTLIALDVLWNAQVPDQVGPWLDAEAHPALARATAVAHTGLYALLVAALIRFGRAIDGGSRFVSVLRWIIIAGYAVFAILFGWIIIDPGYDATGVYELAANLAFAVSLLVPIVLGFALIRRRVFRWPAMLLIAPIVLLPLTLLLQAFTDWAHPGYMETAVNFGVALLCVAASGADSISTRPEVPAGAAAVGAGRS